VHAIAGDGVPTTKRPIGSSWRLDETYISVKGKWKYLYRAVDKAGHTVDFLLTAKRDCGAASRFSRKAIERCGTPEKITIHKSRANGAALEECNRDMSISIELRHLKSICVSVAFPDWCMGHDPAAQILCVSYAQDLSDNLAHLCRSVMTSKRYQSIFGCRPLSRKQALQELETRNHGYRLATSVGGVLTGRGANMIIIDDPLKPEAAVSDSQRSKSKTRKRSKIDLQVPPAQAGSHLKPMFLPIDILLHNLVGVSSAST
jgi:hypothetical protein